MHVRVNLTVDENVKKDFDSICKKNFINRSKWLESKMIEFIKENEKKSTGQ